MNLLKLEHRSDHSKQTNDSLKSLFKKSPFQHWISWTLSSQPYHDFYIQSPDRPIKALYFLRKAFSSPDLVQRHLWGGFPTPPALSISTSKSCSFPLRRHSSEAKTIVVSKISLVIAVHDSSSTHPWLLWSYLIWF